MKKTISLLTLLVPVVSAAATKSFQINSKLFVDGKLISAPKVVTLPGQLAEVSQRTEGSDDIVKINVVATDASNEKVKDGILMKFDVLYKNGPRQVKFSPEILTRSGSSASAKARPDDGDVRLEVTAIRE